MEPPTTTKQRAPVLLLLGLVMILLLYVGNYFERSPEPTPDLAARERTSRMAYSIMDDAIPVQSLCFNEAPSPSLEQFVDQLPIIPSIDVSDGQQHVLKVFKVSQRLHRDLPPTTLYAFGTSQSTAQVPGPALVARRFVPTYIRWENHISDDEHFLAVDYTVTSIPPGQGVPMVPHLHGMESESIYDGHPEAWFTSHGNRGPKYVTQDYIYHNSPLPAMLWYHDHTVGLTRLNIVAGMAGPYIVRGATYEEPVGLPDGDREIILMLQDKQLFPNGSINFPSVGDDTSLHPSWCPAYYGDTMLVNGKVWPYLDVLPVKYRLRIINGASDRYFSLTLDKENMTFLKIGTDGGYLQTPVVLSGITLAPSERVDCIVDFGGLTNGTRVILNNSAPTPFPGGSGFAAFDPASGASAIMEFRVGARGRTESTDTSVVPNISGIDSTILSEARSIRVRRFTLTETINNIGNGTEVLLANRTWGEPATEFVPLGSTEIWEFIGLTPGVDHPIHIHLIKFQMLSVQPINITRYNENNCSIQMFYGQPDSCFLNVSRGPNLQEIGWKDVVSASAAAVTRIVLRFTSQDGTAFSFDPTLGPGYIWHCHLLSHEDNSMMRPLIINYPDWKDAGFFNGTFFNGTLGGHT